MGLGIAEIIGDKREGILRLVEQYGAGNVRVFGSVARGEARPDSDLDLVIDYSREHSLIERLKLKHALEDMIGRPVDLLTDQSLKERGREHIVKMSIAL